MSKLVHRGWVVGFLVVACASLAACGGPEIPPTDCNDGADNDGDGLLDQSDPGCAFNMDQFEAPDPSECNDGLDNDGDGLIDLVDWGCPEASDDSEADPVVACNDGMDNDGDGKVDLAEDPGCETPIDEDEYNPAACMDFLDNDGDGVMDYPYEPGCDSETDDDETNPPTLPACSDGVDNDLDSFPDYPVDPGCNSASDRDEFNVIIGACGPSLVITDITATGEGTGTLAMAAPNELDSDTCNGYGAEFAFTYSVLTGPKALVVSTDHAETTLDTVVYVRTLCRRPDSELGCDDDGGSLGAGAASTLLLPEVPTGTYYIIVDSYGPGSLGDFKLTVEERTPLHGGCDPTLPMPCIPGLLCRGLRPGVGTTCEYHACFDSIDNDADGITDFPFEPGCGNIDDDSEEDPTPVPACGNGVDDDGDLLVDYPADPGCEFAADSVEIDECFPGETVAYLDPVLGATGSTSGTSGAMGTCGSGMGADAPESVFAITPTVELTSLTIDTDNTTTTFNTLLYVRSGDCATGPSVGCGDDIGGGNNRSAVTFDPSVGETYYVFVDGIWGSTGTFHLDVAGVIAGGGACDPSLLTYRCEGGYYCDNVTFSCAPTICNDGLDNDGDTLIDYPFEPGCATRDDLDETDPVPAPQCGNGLDDDLDGMTDYPADDSCTSAAHDNEACAVFGSDAFGYIGCSDIFDVATPPCDDVRTTGAIACSSDDCTSPAITLPFTFTYYGVPQTTLSVGSNGKIGFLATSSYTNGCTIETNTIAAYWDDLFPPTGGSVRYETVGVEPNRRFAVNWNVPHISGGTGLYDIRAVLHEGTNEIDFCYVDTTTSPTLDLGASATIGIKGPGADGVLFSCNTPMATEGLRLRFQAP